MAEILNGEDVRAAGIHDWELMHQALQTRFLTGDFATGLALVNRIGAAAEELNHHPDLDLRYPHLNIRLFSHDKLGVTERDLELARRISAYAAEAGVRADPAAVSVIEIGLDTWDAEEIKPFWRAVLGLKDHPEYDDELRDDDGDLPTLWFQETEKHDEPRQRFHYDIRVPPLVAPQRIRGCPGCGRDAGLGREGADVHRPRRCAGEQGVRLHLARQGRHGSGLAGRMMGSAYQMLGRAAHLVDDGTPARGFLAHAFPTSRTPPARQLTADFRSSSRADLPLPLGRGVFCWPDPMNTSTEGQT